MNVGIIITIIAGVLVLSLLSIVIYRRIPRRLNVSKYVQLWKKIQNGLNDSANWPQALTDADKLLDRALRSRRYKGNRMGERMVAAQKKITNNDAMWFAHNLYKKVIADPSFKLKEADVKTALLGYRSALKDLGALPVTKQPATDDNAEEQK